MNALIRNFDTLVTVPGLSATDCAFALQMFRSGNGTKRIAEMIGAKRWKIDGLIRKAREKGVDLPKPKQQRHLREQDHTQLEADETDILRCAVALQKAFIHEMPAPTLRHRSKIVSISGFSEALARVIDKGWLGYAAKHGGGQEYLRLTTKGMDAARDLLPADQQPDAFWLMQ